MKDFVSGSGTRVVALIASMSIVWIIFRIYDFPWTGVAWLCLACSAAILLRWRSNGSITQMIRDIEGEPVRPSVAPARVVAPAAKVIL